MYIPSQEMGDYEEARGRRKSSGPLYPLSEEGAYGAPPREKPKPRPPLPGYEKRDRKPKVYASYAVSNECSMHSHKLDVNERGQATRGRTPPSRKDSGPLRRESVPRQQAPQQPTGGSNTLSRQSSISRRSSAPRQQPVARRESMSRSSEERSNKWQSSLARDSGYSTKPTSWKDSLRGLSRDSASPPPVRQQRRPSSTMTRKPKRKDSESPRRGRTTSSSPSRRRQSTSPNMMSGGRGGPTDWGYTDFSTFTANRKSSEVSQVSRKSSSMTDRSSMGRQSFSNYNSNTTSRDYNTNTTSNTNNRDYSAAQARDYNSSERDYSAGAYNKPSRRSGDFSSMMERSSATSNISSGTYSKSTGNKIGLSTLKAPVITEWDGMGILGLSSKMFKDSSTNQQGGFSSSSSSFMRRESVTTKVM